MDFRRTGNGGRSTQTGVAALAGAALLGFSLSAHADEPRKVTEPSVLREPAEITQVVDAFDDDDPFDLSITLGYEHTWNHANIRRETSVLQPGLTSGGYTNDTMNVAKYTETTSRLNTRLDIGLFKDIALVVRMPIILANDRKLDDLDGSINQQPVVLMGGPGEQLFSLPFQSPTRSGIEYLAVGLDLGIMNQFRDHTKPTWVFGLEGRFNISEPMHACNANPAGLNSNSALIPPLNPADAQVDCAYPSDINRNGIGGEFAGNPDANGALEGNFSGKRTPGVSRGTTGLELHTYLSKRIKYIEPYGGFKTLFEFQNNSSDYGQSDLKGSLVNHPPLVGTMILGLNVIPWEVRDQFQRITIDFRFMGSYVTEGRDYTELFDALGSSDAPNMRMPQYAEYTRNPNFDPNNPAATDVRSVVNARSQKVYYTGLNDQQQHGRYNFSTQFTWQAGSYVKFNVGGGYTIVQSHFITFDGACNPDFANDVYTAGPCHSESGGNTTITATGIPNPNYRAVINAPGRRFKVDDSNGWDVWLNATVMF